MLQSAKSHDPIIGVKSVVARSTIQTKKKPRLRLSTIQSLFKLTILFILCVCLAIVVRWPDTSQRRISNDNPTTASSSNNLATKEEGPKTTTTHSLALIENLQAKVVHPPLTLNIPAHEASPFIEGLMATLRNQTFTNLHLIFSLEPDADTKITEAAIRKHFQEDNYKHFQSLQIHQQSKRLYYQENMNFLLSKVETDFFSYMQCDDFLSANYYAELVQCLETNPRATNCYPETVTMVNKKSSRNVFMRSIVGPIHERVENVALGMLFIETVCKQATSNTLSFYLRNN